MKRVLVLGLLPGLVGVVAATPAEAGPRAALAWDFNGDRYRDLAVGLPLWQFPDDTNRPYRGAIGVAYGSADGLSPVLGITEGPASVVSGGRHQAFGRALTSGDYNADGYADLAVNGIDDPAGRGTVYLFFGSPDGLPLQPVPLRPAKVTGGKFGFAIATADINKDGYPDLFAAEVFGGHARVYYGGAKFRTQRRSAAVTFDKKAYVRSAAGGDIDGDGYGDIVLSWFRRKDISTRTPDRLSVFRGAGKALRPPGTVKVGGGKGVLAVGDLNGDRRAEIALSVVNGGVRLWRGTRKGFLKSKPVTVRKSYASALSIGGGLLAAGEQRDGAVRVMALTKSGKLVLRATHRAPDALRNQGYGTSVALRDYDGDGRPDVAAGLPYYEYRSTPAHSLSRAVLVSYASDRADQLLMLTPSTVSVSEIVLS